ncbi:DUF4198 domain-containing protein [Pedobacter polaris]|nr:DUF4198 domain-containing protein [Pedobacter polaris]
MKTKMILLVALFTVSISSASAHALWLETASTGAKGQAQEVKAFFGEYTTSDISATKKWFSNLKDFNLVLTAPDGTKTTLKTTADSLFYKASFTPNQDGTYLLSVVHVVKDLYQNAKLQYYAFASVTIGTNKNLNNAFPAEASLTIRPSKLVLHTNESASHQLVFNKAPLAKERITIISPDQKKLEVETDKDGRFNFNPIQKGGYFLEAFAEDKTPGKFDGKNYEKVWHVVTYFTEIK